jgi:DNA-binding NarL/FixJ family response regulator
VSGEPQVRVLVVDDQGVIRAGLRMIVDHEPDFTVVGEADDGHLAVAAAAETAPDVVLMDIRMPRLDGIEATRQILAAAAATGARAPAVLVLTTFDDEEYVLGAIRAGASGFLLKDAGPDVLVDAVRTVHRGDSLVDATVTRHLISHCLELERSLSAVAETAAGAAAAPAAPAPGAVGPVVVASEAAPEDPWVGRLATLSEREREILVGLARGRSNRELAQDLWVSETTVKTHVSSVLSKLELSSRVQAVVLAYETGVVTPGRVRPDVFPG